MLERNEKGERERWGSVKKRRLGLASVLKGLKERERVKM